MTDPINIIRDGSNLTVSLMSVIGYYLTFTHGCGSEPNAEAWRVHLQNYQRRQAEYEQNRLHKAECEKADLEIQVMRLKRAVQYHKRMRRNGAKP